MGRRERSLREKKPPEWTWAEVCGFYRDAAGKAHMMTDKSVIEWARSYLAELRPNDPSYLDRFLTNLANELRQRRLIIDKKACMYCAASESTHDDSTCSFGYTPRV